MNRREFLIKGGCGAMTSLGLISTIANLQLLKAGTMISPISGIPSDPDDYKALVCIFLEGGCDGNELIQYKEGEDHGLHLLDTDKTGGEEVGFHGSCEALAELFNNDKLAILANVGTLAEPTSKSLIEAGKSRLPLQLFSHFDQAIQWQTSLPESREQIGWGGRMAELLSLYNEQSTVSSLLSLNGANVFQSGELKHPYIVNPYTGSVPLKGYHRTSHNALLRKAAIDHMLGEEHSHYFKREVTRIQKRSVEIDGLISSALDDFQDSTPLQTEFPGGMEIADRLKMVAQMIGIRKSMSQRRQVFYVNMPSFDTHANQDVALPILLEQLSSAMKAFHEATVELGLEDKITTFTASDFGRGYVRNGNGTDHGWGNNMMIMGGAVKSGAIYGKMAVRVPEGPDDFVRGSWIPTTSTDEYSATLAKWFGVPESELATILPNIGRFPNPDLGFLNQT